MNYEQKKMLPLNQAVAFSMKLSYFLALLLPPRLAFGEASVFSPDFVTQKSRVL